MEKKYLVMTMQVCFGLEETPDIGRAIQSALDDLRSEGAARAIDFSILNTEEEYQNWYNNHGISEVVIPSPTVVSFD